MDAAALKEWLDRHHVDIIRTHATTLDGPGIGKHLHRSKFFSCLPKGHAVTDMALTMDITGTPHMTMWHPEREPNLGDIYLKPDISTLVSDGTDKQLGHCICDFTNERGENLSLCPRSTLKRMVAMVDNLGYQIKSTYELEFFIFKESFDEARRGRYKRLTPISASKNAGIYNLKNTYLVAPFMNEVVKRLEWKGIKWEAWNDEAGLSQIELNLCPSDAVNAADNVVRTKQILYEVAHDMDLCVTFMPRPVSGYSSGMHIHHSLQHNDSVEPAFFDENAKDKRSALMLQWVAGITTTMQGAVSYLCPTANAFRRFKQYSAVPMTVSWGEENKSTALRLISHTKNLSRIEHRVGSSDLNPYLAMAVILAGGISGVKHALAPMTETTNLAWGLPDSELDLPTTLAQAATKLKGDTYLKEILGETTVNYWAKTREAEWLAFHTEGADALSNEISDWEYDRYFESI